jgi:hypothetical protein
MAKRFLPTLLFVLLHQFTGYAQFVGSRQVNLEAQLRFDIGKCIKDLHYLNARLQDAHPCMYCYTDSLTVHQKFSSIIDSLEKRRDASYNERLTESEFTLMVKEYLSILKDGHLDAGNYSSLARYISNRGRFFPLQLLFESSKVYIHHDFSGYLDTTVIGMELLSINGVPVQTIAEKMYAISSADAGIDIFKTRQLENLERFNISYWMLYEPTDTYKITFKSGIDSTTYTQYVPGITAKEIMFVNEQQKNRPALRIHEMLSTAYMDINSFEGMSDKNEVVRFWQFLEKSFKEINKKKVQHLVIDLRNNPGGMIYNAHLLLNYISEENIASDFQVKSSQLLKETKNQSVFNFFLKNFDNSSYASKIAHTPVGSFIRFSSKDHFIANQRLKFKGKVYLMVNGTTFSAAGLFTKFFKEHNLGVIVGEECGASPTFSFGNVALFDLPHTGLQVYVPTAIVVNDKLHDYANRGIMPDIVINRIIAEEIKGEDSVLRQVMHMISNQNLRATN